MKKFTAFATLIAFIGFSFWISPAKAIPQDLNPVTNVAVRASTNAIYLNGSVTVSWNASADALTYTALASRVGTSDTSFVSVSKDSTQAVIEGLVGGANYTIQVRVNGDGHQSPWSPNTLTAIPLTLPKAPAQPAVEAKVGSATITWTQLVGDEDGGSAVTEYKITEVNTNKSILVSASDSSVTMLNLTEGAKAQFTVSAITDVSPDGVASVSSNQITILASKADAAPNGKSQDNGNAGGGGGGGGGGGAPPSPSATPTPSITASPSPSATPTLTNGPLPTASATPTPTTLPSPTRETGSSFFSLVKSTSKPDQKIVLNSKSSSAKITSGKTLQITLSNIPKGSTVKTKIQAPNGKTFSLPNLKSKKKGDFNISPLSFKVKGTYKITISYGKVTKTVLIQVSAPVKKTKAPVTTKTTAPTKSPVKKASPKATAKSTTKSSAKPTFTVTCTNGKTTKVVKSTDPKCPTGYNRK